MRDSEIAAVINSMVRHFMEKNLLTVPKPRAENYIAQLVDEYQRGKNQQIRDFVDKGEFAPVRFFVSTNCPDFSKTCLRAIAVGILEKKGNITGRDMVPYTNGPSDLFHELRKLGYIKPMAFDTWEVGKSGKRYKVYQWSGKTMEKKDK